MFKRFNARNALINRGYWAKDPDDGQGGGGGGKDGDDTGANDGNDDSRDKGGDDGSKKDDESGDDSDPIKAALAKSESEKAELLKDVMKKKDANKELNSKLESVQAKLKQFDGIDLEEVTKLIADAKERDTKKLEDKGEWEKLKERMAGEHQAELTAAIESRDSTIAELTDKLGQVGGTIERLTVGQSFDNSKYISDELTLTPSKARIIYGKHFDVENGSVVAYDKPRGEDGRTPYVDGSGNNISFDEALKKIVANDPDADDLIRSKMKPGADSKTIDGKAPDKKVALKGLSRIQNALNEKKST